MVNFLLAIGILLAPWQKVAGDELRFATAAQWHQWELPLGAVELTQEGSIRPVAVRRNNNAALDAVAFGGGISRVGSNALEAPGVLDGDGDTGWRPDLDEKAEDWFIEVDLGRVVSAHRVHLIFSAHGPPFEIFDLAGRRVAGVESMGTAGPLRLTWDGLTGMEEQVPPGNYVARLKVEGDGSTEQAVELVSIVY